MINRHSKLIRLSVMHDDGRHRTFQVDYESGVTLLDAIIQVHDMLDDSVEIRWNCRTGQCGLCAVRLNNEPRLACLTSLRPGREYRIEPIDAVRAVHSLVCDLTDIYRQFFLESERFKTELSRKRRFESLLLHIPRTKHS